MNIKYVFALVICILFNSSNAFGQETQKIISHPDFASNISLLESWIQRQILYQNIPGVSVGLVYDGKLIYQKGFGYSDVENKILATPDTRYRIASQSKMFTSIGIMILRDEGKLRLDDPIQNYLPWLELNPVNTYDSPITIHQLLTHSSGLPRDVRDYWTDFNFPTQEEFRKLASSLNMTLIYPPYTDWKYSNNAFVLLGEIIEAISGKKYEDFIRDEILIPLNLPSTNVVQDESYQSTLAVGYGRRKPDGSRQKFKYTDVKTTSPMSGISSSVTDLSKFVAWQMRLLYQNEKKILNPNTLREMQRVQFLDDDWRWGLGFSIYHDGKDFFIGHGGSHVGYNTNTSINVAEKIGVIVCVNSIGGNAFHGTTWSITDRMYEWLSPAVKKATTEIGQIETPHKFQEYEGLYSNIWNESLVIYLDGKLQIVNPNSPNPKIGAWVLELVLGDTFKIMSTPRYSEEGEIMNFKRNTQGKIVGFESGVGGTSSNKIAGGYKMNDSKE